MRLPGELERCMISVSAEGMRTIDQFSDDAGGPGPFVEIALRAWDSSGRGGEGAAFVPSGRIDVRIDVLWRQRGLDGGRLGPALDAALRSYRGRFQPKLRAPRDREELEFQIPRGVLLEHSVAAFRSAHPLVEDLGMTLEAALIEIERQYTQPPWEGKTEDFAVSVDPVLYDRVRIVLKQRHLDFDTLVSLKLAELVGKRFA